MLNKIFKVTNFHRQCLLHSKMYKLGKKHSFWFKYNKLCASLAVLQNVALLLYFYMKCSHKIVRQMTKMPVLKSSTSKGLWHQWGVIWKYLFYLWSFTSSLLYTTLYTMLNYHYRFFARYRNKYLTWNISSCSSFIP